MADSVNTPAFVATKKPQFTTTHWSVVIQAKDSGSAESLAALERLCDSYWYPIYAFIRKQGRSPDEAQDLTQEFFARLIEKEFLTSVDRTKGKFRTFLLAAVQHFLAKEWNRAHRLKRGGNVWHVSLDAAAAEERFNLEPHTSVDPQKLFERRWALTVLEQAMNRLRDECDAAGKGALFKELKGVLTGESDAKYAEIAGRLQMTEGAIKVNVHRLRQRYAELLRLELSETVSHPDEVEDELRHLMAALPALPLNSGRWSPPGVRARWKEIGSRHARRTCGGVGRGNR